MIERKDDELNDVARNDAATVQQTAFTLGSGSDDEAIGNRKTLARAVATACKAEKKKTGKDFETTIAEAATHYARLNLLYLEKTDPPVQVIRFPKFFVIQKRNPWLDYAGTWTEFRGRALIIEAKSMTGHRLSFTPNRDNGNGLGERQIRSLRKWHHAGAFVGVLFEWRDHGVVWFKYSLLAEAMNNGAKSLRWEDGWPVEHGEFLDFRTAMIEAARNGVTQTPKAN